VESGLTPSFPSNSPGISPELATYLFHDGEGRLTDRGHGKGRTCHWDHAADKHPDNHHRVVDQNSAKIGRLCIGYKKGQGGKGCGTNGKPFSDGSGRVAKGVEAVGDLPGLRAKTCHLRDTARVVSDGAIGIHGHGCPDRC